jgi:hypothetical protein
MKRDEEVRAFVNAYTDASAETDKISRWTDPMCPAVAGLSDDFNKFIAMRITQVAKSIGAPVSPAASCKANIDVVFSDAPQVILDALKQTNPVMLGQTDGPNTGVRSQMSFPIQAWYTTQSQDWSGNTSIDDSRRNTGMTLMVPRSPGNILTSQPLYLPRARETRISGSRISEGLQSQFHHVVVLADNKQIEKFELGAVADYVAMLVLAKTRAAGACKGLRSISNLLAEPCDANYEANALSPDDLAYLRGLYKSGADGSLNQQKTAIVSAMKTGNQP